MYTEQNKGFTIITNFGCYQKCKYCITREHPILKNEITDETKIDWKYLEKCISESNAPTVNLSGGGDPFYQYPKHYDFYQKVYDLASKYEKKLDIHTRIIPIDLELISKFRKIALTIEPYDFVAMSDLKKTLPCIKSCGTLIRVVDVLNERMTEQHCLDYIDRLHKIGIKQITFRQMFGNKAAYENFLKIKELIKIDGVMFLPDGEYHTYYFTTNNTLYPYFFGYTENDRLQWMKKYEEIEQSCG